MNYPCKECLLKGNCSSSCLEVQKISRLDNTIINEKRCPCCGETNLLFTENDPVPYVIFVECKDCKNSFIKIYDSEFKRSILT